MIEDERKTTPVGRTKAGKFCPFLKKPFDDCLCVDMNSQKTFDVLYYCRVNFEECEIYQKNRPAIKGSSNAPVDGEQ